MSRSRWCRRLAAGLTGVAAGLAGGTATAQDADRGRAAVEAASQAAEADRLLKLGEFAQALPLYEAERASRAATGDLRYEAYARRAIGICRAELGDDGAAIAEWRQAYDLDLKRDDPGYAGYDDFLIGQAEWRLGRVDAAIATLERSLTRLNGAADRDHEADAQLALVHILIGAGRAADARPHVARALAVAEAAGDAPRRAEAWAASGQVEGAMENPTGALDHFGRAQKLFEQQGRAAEAAWMETTQGSALYLLGRPAEALARFEEAAKRHRHLEDGGAVAEDLTAAAGIHLEADRLDAALAAATEAVEQARDADDRPREVEARVRLAQAQGLKNDWAGAAATLDEAVLLGRQVARDDPAEQVRILLTAAATDARAGLAPRAAERIATAARVADEAKSPDLRQAVADASARLKAATPPPPTPAPPR